MWTENKCGLEGGRVNELKKVIESLFLAGYSRRTVIRMVKDIWNPLIWEVKE